MSSTLFLFIYLQGMQAKYGMILITFLSLISQILKKDASNVNFYD